MRSVSSTNYDQRRYNSFECNDSSSFASSTKSSCCHRCAKTSYRKQIKAKLVRCENGNFCRGSEVLSLYTFWLDKILLGGPPSKMEPPIWWISGLFFQFWDVSEVVIIRVLIFGELSPKFPIGQRLATRTNEKKT